MADDDGEIGWSKPEEGTWPARICVVNLDGTIGEDVTEHVVSMLDVIRGSMDWGSGFLYREDVEGMGVLASALGLHKIVAAVEATERRVGGS